MQINKQKYTLSQVEEIIDSHIESDTNFTFVCNFELAHYIYDYLGNEYDVEADSIQLSSEVDEYYVSLNFYKNDITFVCEYAKWDQAGTYKYDDGDKIDYFVFSNMSFGDIREYLSGDGCIRFCELIDEDEELCNCNDCDCKDGSACDGCGREVDNGNVEEKEELVIPCDCVDCKSARGEFTEDEEYEIGLVEHYAQYIESSPCECGSELRNILYSMLQECMSMGYENSREEMREFLED